ncbi:MAG: MscL family protein, partial [Rhizobiaceae bacterium]|nr:MscL family protein [Rhizobiaceae bacterium]
FMIIAWCIFMLLKVVTRVMPKKEEEAAPAGPSEEVLLLREIRDSLRNR